MLTKKLHITKKIVDETLTHPVSCVHNQLRRENMPLTETELKRLEIAQRSFPLIDIESIVYMGMQRPQALKHLAYYENKAKELKL